ncbi:MAG: hypothetical protein K2M12_02005 [Muribaculaceae bacterium]|nr:hypothetical protein [Muribaculaceae bacterium]
MKVRTLDISSFDEACRRLEQAIGHDGFRPDVVVGIESGGRFVAEKIFVDVPHAYVAVRRPSTSSKKGVVRSAISHLPIWICDILRIAEARLLNARKPSPSSFEGELPKSLCGQDNILIVDDAVDSGVTMQAVYDAVRSACPSASVKTAAITVTTSRPLIVPDISLYNQLIRFPWSMDAHN